MLKREVTIPKITIFGIVIALLRNFYLFYLVYRPIYNRFYILTFLHL